MRKKAYLILTLVILLALGAGAFSPAAKAAAQSKQAQNSACDHASTFLTGRLGELPRVKELIHDICDFRVRMNQLNRNVSRFDRMFIEHAIAANMLEIQTLEYTLERTTDEEFRGLIQMMIIMHTSDLEMALEVAEEIGADTTPDLTNMRVYPKTPEYDLGIRRINLVARFLDPLMSVPGGTPTPTHVTMTPTAISTATVTGTVLPPVTPTTSGTAPPIFTPTGTATAAGTATSTRTAVVTGTGTAITPMPNGTGTGTVVATGTTAVATGTGTGVPTGTRTPTAIGTMTGTGTGTVVVTSTMTGVATGTTTPTVLPPTRPDFDMLALHVIEDEHVMHIEVALVAQRLAKNSEIQAFAKHAADAAKLHLLLLNDLKYRMAHGYTLPAPDFQEDYQSPRRLEATDEDN